MSITEVVGGQGTLLSSEAAGGLETVSRVDSETIEISDAGDFSDMVIFVE